MENVLSGFSVSSEAIAVISEESIPPLKKVPSGTSLLNLSLIESFIRYSACETESAYVISCLVTEFKFQY